jgi:hypothetical protein
MYGKVKRLRDRGARLSDHDIARAVPVEGAVVVAGIGGTLMAEVRDPSSQVGTGLLPPLYEVRLLGMHNGKILLKGEERPQGNAGPAYVQEWSIAVEPS